MASLAFAVGFTEFAGPDVLQVLELPIPEAGPGEARIRVHAATVDAVDALQRGGPSGPPDAQPPFLPGMEAAGVVDRMGPGSDADLRVGDRAMVIVLPNGTHGAYAEQLVVPPDSVVRAPHDATDAQAASLPTSGLTARLATGCGRAEPTSAHEARVGSPSFAEDGVVEPLQAHGAGRHVVTSPPMPAVLVRYGEFAHQTGQPWVARVHGAQRAQMGHARRMTVHPSAYNVLVEEPTKRIRT